MTELLKKLDSEIVNHRLLNRLDVSSKMDAKQRPTRFILSDVTVGSLVLEKSAWRVGVQFTLHISDVPIPYYRRSDENGLSDEPA